MLKKIHCNLNDELIEIKDFIESEEVYYLAPALMDIQVNGYDTVSIDKELTVHALECMMASMLRDGVSQFVPTVISCSFEHMVDTLENTREFMRKHPGVIPGVHLEGPFISEAKRGIHSAEYVRNMTAEDLKVLLSFKNEIAYLTIDPDAVDQISQEILIRNNIKLSLGHTSCDYARAMSLFDTGATLATHLYNAMTKSPNGRNPMAVEAVVAKPGVYAGVIVDGIHVAYPMVKIAWRLLGDHFILTTDALSAAGVKNISSYVSFSFADKTIYNDPLRGCIDEKGTLAGSRLTMLEGVRNLVEACDLTLEQAVFAGSVAPRRAMKLKSNNAYIVLDKNLNLVKLFDLNN